MTTKKLIVCVLLLFLTSCASTTSVPVQTEHGNISGLLAGEDPVVTIYKGIPYAAPPVDQLRWKPPQAVKAWKGVRKMEKFGNTFRYLAGKPIDWGAGFRRNQPSEAQYK